MHQSKFLGACVLLAASAWAAESPSTILPALVPETSTTGAPPLPEAAPLNSEALPIPEAHVSAQLQLGDASEHSGGPKVRKAAQSSNRDMTPSSTVPPTTLRVNDYDRQRDNRDRYYPDYRYPDSYRGYDNRGYDPQGYPPPGGYGGYGAPSQFYNDYDRSRGGGGAGGGGGGGYNTYYNEPWRQRLYDPYYDRDPYYNRYGRSYGERPSYTPYGNDYFLRPDRIDPYRFGYSTDKLGRGFGYSCKDVFECQDLKNREEAQRDAQRRSYAPYPPVSSNYRAPYEHSNLWLPPTPAPTSGRSVTYFPQDRYDPYAHYTGGGYGGYTPYYQGGFRNDYYRTKKK